jgi:hypothetical protein
MPRNDASNGVVPARAAAGAARGRAPSPGGR